MSWEQTADSGAAFEHPTMVATYERAHAGGHVEGFVQFRPERRRDPLVCAAHWVIRVDIKRAYEPHRTDGVPHGSLVWAAVTRDGIDAAMSIAHSLTEHAERMAAMLAQPALSMEKRT